MNQEQRLLPLAPEDGAPPTCCRALSALYAEDGITEEELDAHIEEGKTIFPGIEELTLYFRSRSSDVMHARPLLSDFMHTKWKECYGNSGHVLAGRHGMLTFVVVRLPSQA